MNFAAAAKAPACGASFIWAVWATIPIRGCRPTCAAGTRSAKSCAILASKTIEFRASIIIGAGSLSFELVKSLTDRLPVMICPRWLTTPTQPIAVDDVVAYLLAARELPPGNSRVFEIGGADVVTYGDIIREYARQRGLRRMLISVPLLTPYLSSLWLALVTPTDFAAGRHLIEGLKNPTVVRDQRALREFLDPPASSAGRDRCGVGRCDFVSITNAKNLGRRDPSHRPRIIINKL